MSSSLFKSLSWYVRDLREGGSQFCNWPWRSWRTLDSTDNLKSFSWRSAFFFFLFAIYFFFFYGDRRLVVLKILQPNKSRTFFFMLWPPSLLYSIFLIVLSLDILSTWPKYLSLFFLLWGVSSHSSALNIPQQFSVNKKSLFSCLSHRLMSRMSSSHLSS